MLPHRYVAAALALTAAASLAGCDRHGGAPAPKPAAAHVVVIEQGGQMLTPRDTGAVYALRLANEGAVAQPFTAASAVADPTLTVTVLGLTDCLHGCVGGGPLTAETERDARASVDPSLTSVPPSSAYARSTGTSLLAVVLLVRVAAHPAPGTCAYVHAITIPHSPPLVAHDGGWVANVSTPVGEDNAPAC